MAYEVLARKWRPQKFAEVVGQEQTTKTLQSELLQNKLAHAYLFVGSRGIGKTTIARIFAKAMNCERAPITEPCCECDSCKSIADGNCIDLIEIDGASNNSVENIRNICEEVLYAPIRSRYKVYIIDEVHMLTASAWNALLKTIEEPPPHAKFLFATTEAHKVLPTVVSRCQRFDLRSITFTLISDQLKKIATTEGVAISDAAIEVLARAADGGMRDAQSLLDQMIAFSSSDQGEITEEQTLSVFGLTGVAEMEHLLTSILVDDRPGLITSIHKIASHGKNLEKLFEDIVAFLRGIHICMLMPNPESVLETGADMIATYKKVGAVTNTKVVHKMLEQLSSVGTMLHNALNKQVFIEMILLKSMRVAHAVEIEDLLARLNQIRKTGGLEVLESMPPAAKETPKTPSATAPTPAPAATPAPTVATATPTATQPPLAKPSSAKIAEPSPTPAVATSTPAATPVQQTPVVALAAQPETNATPPPVASAPEQCPTAPTPQPSSSSTPPPAIPIERSPSTNATPSAAPHSSPTPVTEPPKQQCPTAPSPQERPAQPAAPMQTVTVRPVAPYPATPPAPALEVNDTRQPFIATPSPQSGALNTTPPAIPSPPPQASAPTTSSLEPVVPATEKDPVLLLNPITTSTETNLAQAKATASSSSKLESPNAVWHALTQEMERCDQPLLKAYMKEGMPKSYNGGVLSIAFDEEFDSLHAAALQKEKALLETCLRRLTGDRSATLKIIHTSGIASPHKIEIVDDVVKEEIKKRAETNPFVQGVMNLFEGEIVDVRG